MPPDTAPDTLAVSRAALDVSRGRPAQCGSFHESVQHSAGQLCCVQRAAGRVCDHVEGVGWVSGTAPDSTHVRPALFRTTPAGARHSSGRTGSVLRCARHVNNQGVQRSARYSKRVSGTAPDGCAASGAVLDTCGGSYGWGG